MQPCCYRNNKAKEAFGYKRIFGNKKISPFEVKLWIGIAVALIIVIDSVTYLFGKPIVVEFMTSIYNSTNHRWFLFLALVVAAPVFEEIFFRGFLLSGFSATFIGPIGAVIITSLTWAAIHLQYDLYGILTIFVIGIVLGVARLKTESIITVIMMHSLMNAIAFFETVIYVSL